MRQTSSQSPRLVRPHVFQPHLQWVVPELQANHVAAQCHGNAAGPELMRSLTISLQIMLMSFKCSSLYNIF